ncbi:ATP-dependent helicase HrpB [Shewanella intestini]|uniref:ATP-dependent helicase HrpB n=1 Tax=Shewanella intestini TaxID=2017544 RepID=A0ABS5I310_9GAMM|nr:ATP-dependent helicase HrpB [Shewanella sp. XMDDZSB0408]MBR9727730.1 ATP-dependent helicase HrpB [Shewanella intestini]MRG35120.1 ATP-dependent helicase HrpB [Shewanella sp. XMDDZSB0408]
MNYSINDAQRLPVASIFAPLRQALQSHQQVIIEAPTGAGKSTALPLEMLSWPELSGKILMLEPRRVATRNVAAFIAKCLAEPLGKQVGYRVRGEAQVSKETRLEVVTEGILTSMIQQDPELTGIDTIIFDEIHERHLTTDIGLALALEVQQSWREDLKIVAMSATLSGLPLQSLMPKAIHLCSEGRSFPIEVDYRPALSQQPWLNHLAKVILELVSGASSYQREYSQGSILIFLPGKGEIQRLAHLLSAIPRHYIICPLYGDLSPSAQQQAVAAAPTGMQKIVLATNVAESSLTIDGVSVVIDSGYQREASFNPKNGVTRLALKRISQASAAQRSGRAGRLSNGLSIRLWSHEEQGRLPVTQVPEISQSELTQVVFECAQWGERQLNNLPLLTPAPRINEQLAWGLLQQLQLVDNNNKLTPLGNKAYALGVHPRLAFMLLQAQTIAANRQQPTLVVLACCIAAIIDARALPRKGIDIHAYLPLALQGSMKQQVHRWLTKLQQPCELDGLLQWATDSDISLLVALAFPDRIARARGQSGFLLSHGCGVTVAPEEALANEPWIVVADFQEHDNHRSGRVYLACKLTPALFEHELAHLVTQSQTSHWDEAKGRFVAQRMTQIGHLVLNTQAISAINQELIVAALLEQVRQKGLILLHRYDELIQLQCRVALAQQYDQIQTWPDISEQQLISSLDHWLAPYLSDIKSMARLAKLDVCQLVLNQLPWSLQQTLNERVPTHWPMLTGTNAPIHYQIDPSTQKQASSIKGLIRVRLQEALGMTQSPMLFNGKVALTMELLSPAQRQIALTADLASFWQGPYEHLKKEMKGRYPKHLWPDDPANTPPTKMTKKKTLGL